MTAKIILKLSSFSLNDKFLVVSAEICLLIDYDREKN